MDFFVYEGKKEEKTPKNKDCARVVFCAKQ